MIDFLQAHPTLVAVALAVWVGFHFVLRPTLTGLFRERLFEIRDELFDAAADGHVRFDEPSYRLLRQEINAAIFSAHMLNFGHVLWFAACHKWAPRPGDGTLYDVGQRLESRMEEIQGTPAEAILRTARRRVLRLCAANLVMSSVFVVLFLALSFVLALIGYFVNRVSGQCADLIDRVGQRAVDVAVEMRADRCDEPTYALAA